MKKILLAVALVASTVGMYSFSTKTAGGEVYAVNTSNSKVEFSGAKSEGYHPGYFNLKGGEVNVEGGKIVGGKFVIDLASVKVTDFAGEKLEGHLKAPDFFDLGKSSEATYVISNVKYSGANKISVDGILTLKGVTAPVKFTGVVRGLDDKKLFAEATFTLDKSAFGIATGPKLAGVANDVQITVHLFAGK